MTYAGINITDSDSMDAAADLRESYDAYTVRMADELAAENGWTEEPVWPVVLVRVNATDDDPQPPSPAAPALRLVPGPGGGPELCPACNGARICALAPHVPCWYCSGTGTNALPADLVNVVAGVTPRPTSIPFDRARHCRAIASYGGMATFTTHGTHHMRAIGTAGARVTIDRYGVDDWRGIVTGKGWTAPRRPDLLSDLRAGRELAALDRLAA